MERNLPVIEVVDDEVAEILLHKTPAERLEMAFGMWHSARDMLTAILMGEHPGWPEDKIASEVARRLFHGTV
ncbi:MAG: hypothetical protein GY906_18225 [bacterium]|nr:hypothetical protein [bacterium]